MAPPISICIAAKDEETKIGRALTSALACPWAAEVVVFDSGSTDRTPQIAAEAGAKVETIEWTSYSDSKRRMTERAANDWVFILDADEQITPDLSAQIAALSDEAFERHPIFIMPRRNFIFGRHVRAWDPDDQTRLIDRRRVKWPERAVHDERLPTEGTPKRLTGPLLHNADVNEFADYFEGARYDARTKVMAQELYDAGKRCTAIDLWFRPLVAFVKYYLLKGGFLQGTFGLLMAQKAANFVQLKYARLWHVQKTAGKAERDG